MKFYELRNLFDRLKAGTIQVEELSKYRGVFNEFADYVIDTENKKYAELTEKVLGMLNDYYSFSDDGDVLITDRKYDELTSAYQNMTGNDQVQYTVSTPNKSWNLRPHLSPSMVGSISKVYDVKSVMDFLRSESEHMTAEVYRNAYVVFAPKYDGASIVITFKAATGDIIAALTRKDGINGQDETELIKRTDPEVLHNMKEKVRRLVNSEHFDPEDTFVDVKCEMMVTTNAFQELILEKKYANRRAAASAISSNPSNIKYAKYLILVPLAYKIRDPQREVLVYEPGPVGGPGLDQIKPRFAYRQFALSEVDYSLASKSINDILKIIRDPEFGLRVDGVVVFIDSPDLSYRGDAMGHSIAYKTNSSIGETYVIDGYFSIGRTGKATPMLHVEDCDVNETIVNNVNMSNMAKVAKFCICKGDRISIESAGDVIPMLKEVVEHNDGELIAYSRHCPYCGKKMEVVESSDGSSFDLYCKNDMCPRIQAGVVANFLDKIGVRDISDDTIIDLLGKCKKLKGDGLELIVKVFELDEDDLKHLEGWGKTSAEKFVNTLRDIRHTPILASRFLGSLGIPKISVKKCRNLMVNFSLPELLSACHRSDSEDAEMLIMGVDGFSRKTAHVVVKFIKENYKEILEIADLFDEIQQDIKNLESLGNVVFTGFRDERFEEEITDLGFDVGDNVNKDTVAVMAASTTTGKAKKAIEKGLPVFKPNEIDDLIDFLRRLK